MSTVSPSHGSNSGGGGGSGGVNQSYSTPHHPSSTPSHSFQHHSHHSSSQDGSTNLSGMPNTSFDSVSSHHGHPPSSQQSQHSQPHQSQPIQQASSQHQQQQQHQHHHHHHNSNYSNNQWGGPGMQYGSNTGVYPSSHGVYNQQAGYYSAQSGHPTSTTTYGGGAGGAAGGPYPSYSLQPHQGYSLYGSHASSQGGTPSQTNPTTNGSAHHNSGNSTPNSATPYSHHSANGNMLSSNQSPYYHQSSAGNYYGSSGVHSGSTTANGIMSQSPSYTSAPQYSTQLPLAGRHRVTTTLWEDEGTLCFQVDARGVCVARRHDNNMINGTKLLNVCGMSRGKRDGILKNEKERIVVKVGAMHLKGVWITFQRGKQLAEQNDIQDVLYPLFETNIQSFLYHPDNYPRTAAVIAAAQERQRSRVSVGTQSPNGYPTTQRAASHAGQFSGQQQNHPPLMRANTTPSGHLMQQGSAPVTNSSISTYHQPNGYSHHHLQQSPYAQSHSVSSAREVPVGANVNSGSIGQGGEGDVDNHGGNTRMSNTNISIDGREEILDDFKMSNTGKPPLHSSNMLNSYAFTNGPIKYQRNALSERDNISRSDTLVSMPHSDPLWSHRNDAFHSQ